MSTVRTTKREPLKYEGFMRLMKRHRMAKGLTITQLAGKLKVSVAAVHGWESGRSLPKPSTIPKLARIFELTPLELTQVISPEPTPPAPVAA